MIDLPSPNFDERPAGTSIDMLVLHYTGMPSAKAAIERLTDPAAQVSAHYLIDEDGACHGLVDENVRAWHAGRSFWRGRTDLNARSIGIELVNPGHEFGYRPFPEAQMTALIRLARDILGRHPIPPRNVVGHADVAPRRKEDPGELFDWRRLAAEGIGLWPAASETDAPPPPDWPNLLERLGYDVADLAGETKGTGSRAALVAFQRHYRPRRFDGMADGETISRMTALLEMTGEMSR
ncbi:N-acetylmuramoyl-L-alanine amidase [Telmatospirillum siberiense]|uniref:N-acetylmuramoyl-L-alanine amidase n=1 Tax=Telmatospirillum siberiense TaxID=382514 RepID=A0A2N3PQP4_9PROT|nr:N-acetylmuramoyl-L-alanine amidase [Telmatospirillum siberiense]PKU22721.1 N-acetylmuramoyl-L-alanine amidase [Telmatospirillum siberiense]